jgi:hypothetical protein
MIFSADDGEDSGAPVSPHKRTRVEGRVKVKRNSI